MPNFIQNRREARKREEEARMREEATQRKLDIKTREHELESVYKKGSETANAIARRTISKTKKKVGFVL